jgi:hypothetical protein
MRYHPQQSWVVLAGRVLSLALTLSLTLSLTLTLSLSLTRSLTHSLSLTHTHTHSLTHSLSLSHGRVRHAVVRGDIPVPTLQEVFPNLSALSRLQQVRRVPRKTLE